MAITPTPHLFTAISAAELAKTGNRGTARQFPDPAAESDSLESHRADTRQAAETNPAETQQQASNRRPDESTESRLDASPTKATTEGEPGSTVAAEFRREAVGPSRPQYQRPGQLVDLSV